MSEKRDSRHGGMSEYNDGNGAYIRVPDSIEDIERWRDAATRDKRVKSELRSYVNDVADTLTEAHNNGQSFVWVP